MSSEQPSSGKAGTAIFKYAMSMETLRQECESLFGADLPPPKLPHALSDKVVGSKLKTVGGVVFTNGHLDEWAGGETDVELICVPIDYKVTTERARSSPPRPLFERGEMHTNKPARKERRFGHNIFSCSLIMNVVTVQ